jgi:glycerophosphoryl diester phosphodiesterase
MMIRNLLYLVFPTLFTSCHKQLAAPIPDIGWDLFNSPGAVPVPVTQQNRMEGIYQVTEGADLFGEQVVMKWTWLANGQDTTYHVSIFCEKNIAYMTGEGRVLDGSILLNMYWRTLVNTETGLTWLVISNESGGSLLMGNTPDIGEGSIMIEGNFGRGNERPATRLAMRYVRPLNPQPGFYVLAHRGGGRNADQMPASENSVELIRKAPQLGATGVEIDVKLTSDDVPVLYHDTNLNPRLVRDSGLHGPIRDHSMAQLDALVRLVNGEKIPTLAQALHAIIHQTDLKYVWLDVKYEGPLEPVWEIQKQYIDMAAGLGRDVRILIGLPGQDQVDKFLKLPDHQNIPSLCELSLDVVRQTNSEVWAPMWVMGQQDGNVLEMQGEGRKVFVWTMDVAGFIQQYMYEGHYDGILSNFPSLVAYYHYTRP